MTSVSSERLAIGWREWVSLPDLGLPAVKAKVDTGAKTSSLHAFSIEPFFSKGVLHVRFLVHPLQDRRDIVVTCEAPVIDYRSVSDSGGHREKRYVVSTRLVIGGLETPVEITLANRETMSHRMLIGRSAMKHLVIDPNHEYLLGRPDRIVRAYKKKKKLKKKKTRKKSKTASK